MYTLRDTYGSMTTTLLNDQDMTPLFGAKLISNIFLKYGLMSTLSR